MLQAANTHNTSPQVSRIDLQTLFQYTEICYKYLERLFIFSYLFQIDIIAWYSMTNVIVYLTNMWIVSEVSQ